jgi:hypothetical protein
MPGHSSRQEENVNSGDWNMIGMVARWGHNALLVALALMTLVLFFGLIK